MSIILSQKSKEHERRIESLETMVLQLLERITELEQKPQAEPLQTVEKRGPGRPRKLDAIYK